mmetsp:Transcript_113565/g.242402  ORF Transcript_113565/g.242402 Transcript_113565/m.242402 type:complete len:374 (-) Transcript_113565:110-1231(-)
MRHSPLHLHLEAAELVLQRCNVLCEHRQVCLHQRALGLLKGAVQKSCGGGSSLELQLQLPLVQCELLKGLCPNTHALLIGPCCGQRRGAPKLLQRFEARQYALGELFELRQWCLRHGLDKHRLERMLVAEGRAQPRRCPRTGDAATLASGSARCAPSSQRRHWIACCGTSAGTDPAAAAAPFAALPALATAAAFGFARWHLALAFFTTGRSPDLPTTMCEAALVTIPATALLIPDAQGLLEEQVRRPQLLLAVRESACRVLATSGRICLTDSGLAQVRSALKLNTTVREGAAIAKLAEALQVVHTKLRLAQLLVKTRAPRLLLTGQLLLFLLLLRLLLLPSLDLNRLLLGLLLGRHRLHSSFIRSFHGAHVLR